jgi:microcystin degradation protein MlrC
VAGVDVKRIGVGRIWHESNGFFAVPTTLDDFRSYPGGLVLGDALLDRGDADDELTGMLDVFRDEPSVQPVPLLAAAREPSGAIAADSADALADLLRRQLQDAGPLDAVCFSLHGAMTGAQTPDLDGRFLQVIRDEVGGSVPVVCSLDCHAVVSRQMIELATALTAYRTHPHRDVAETGRRAARILLDVLAGRTRPVIAAQKIPLLFVDRGTVTSPLDRLFDKFIAWDDLDGVIACSLCPAYPYQDVPEQGWTALVVTDDDPALAQRLAQELARDVWDARHELKPEPMLPPHDALREARRMSGSPILVTDSADNVGAGARGDTTGILQAMLDTCRDCKGLVLANFTDAQAADIGKSHDVGQTVTVQVGGESDPRYGEPVPVTATIEAVSRGPIPDDGKFTGQPTLDVGAIVCLAVGALRIVLTEHPVWGPHPSLFRKVGIEPFEAKIVVVKSGIGYRVTYGSVARGVIDADCPGPGSRNVRHFDFQAIPRPMFPLDDDLPPSDGSSGWNLLY